jgi:two-component system NtrC family sensor kinase
MRKYLLLIIIASATLQSNAQLHGQPLIDSLLIVIPKAKDDTNKVKMLNDLALTYYSINPEEGIKFGKQALTLAEKVDWQLGMAYAYKVIAGNYGYGLSDFSRGLEYALKSLELFREIGNKMGEAKVLGDIGVIYWFQSDFPNALKYYLDALRIHEELGIKNEIAATLGNVGIVYNSQGDYRKALEYMLKGNQIDEEIGNLGGVAANLGNIGEIYLSLKDTVKALEFNLKSMQLYEEMGDKNGVSRNLTNLGNIYTGKGDYRKGLDYYTSALKLQEELGYKQGLATTLGNIGNNYLQIEKANNRGRSPIALQQAKEYTMQAISIAREIGDMTTLLSNYKRLSDIQSLSGDHKSALDSYINYTLFKDSVFNMEKEKKLTETAMRYEFDKKEAAMKAEQEKKDILQRNIRNSIIAGATLLLLLLIASINRYRYKQKANKKLTAAYENLKSTQQQLIRSEKMAAFGAMASRMAHEIQNPLNFVNNFSTISKELVHDIVTSHNEEEKREISNLLVNNLEKIHHHGNRAASIINQLQDHARAGTAQEFFEEEHSPKTTIL